MTTPLHDDDPRRLGRFEILGRLGAGGMGQVYLGRDGGGRLAAVKVVHAGLAGDPQFRRRFAREISTARAARAPWTAAVVAADPDGPRPWLATEYVDGPSLDHVVGSAGPLRESAVGILAARLSQALAGLHATGIVHRDLKPSNVLLADDGPRLIDFGIARAIDSTKITHTGAVVGTPAFMSPEQANGDDAGAPSDVFSLAAVLTYAARGRGPFGHTPNPVAMLLRVLDDEPDLTGVPAPVRERLEPCLVREPAARPSAAALAERLTPLDPHGARWQFADPPPPVPGRRRGWLVAGAVAAAVALLVTLVVVLAPRGAGSIIGGANPDLPAALALPGTPIPPTTPAREVAAVPVGNLADDALLSPDGSRAYVLESQNVSVIDTASRAVVTQITPPGGPSGIGMSPDGSRVFIATSTGFVSVLDTAAGALTATIPAGSGLGPLAVVGDGRLVYVTVRGDFQQETGSVAVVDTTTSTVIATVSIEVVPDHIAATPDGRLVYVWGRNESTQTFSVIDTATNTVVGSIPLETVDGITMAPDGQRAYVLNGLGTITVLDPAAMAVAGEFRSPLGERVVDIAVSPDSTHLYLAVAGLSDGPNALRVVDATTTFVVEDAPLSVPPTGIGLSSDGNTLVAASFDADAAVIVDTSGYAGIGGAPAVTVADPAGPVVPTTVELNEERTLGAGLALSPSGDRVYVTSEEGIVVLEAATSKRIGTIATEQGVRHLVVDPAGTRAYTSTLDGIEVIDLTTNLVVATFDTELVYKLIGVSADGTRLITSIADASGQPAISRVDLPGGEVTTLAPAGNDGSVAMTADGATVYLGSQPALSGPAPVTAIDTTTGASRSVPGTDNITVLTMGADGRTLYGVGSLRRIVLDTADDSLSVDDSSRLPYAAVVAASPTGDHLFAPEGIDGTVSVVDTGSGDVLTTLPTGGYPGAIEVTPDGRRLFVASEAGLSVLDVSAYG